MRTPLLWVIAILGVAFTTSCEKENIEPENDQQSIRVIITEQNANDYGISFGDTISIDLEVEYVADDWEYEDTFVFENEVDTTFYFTASEPIIEFNLEVEQDSSSVGINKWFIEQTYQSGSNYVVNAWESVTTE